MAFLDFLSNRGNVPITPFDSSASEDGAGLFAGTATPPPQAAAEDIQPPKSGIRGFLDNLTATGDDGVSFSDKLYAAGAILQNDPNALSGIQAKRTKYTENQAALAKEAKLAQERAKKAAALKAAYVNGKFNPQAYIEAMAGDVGLDDLTAAQRLAPQGGVEGGYAYTKDPFTGQVTFGEQRPISRAEQLAQERFDEQERRNQVLEDIARGRLGVAQGQLGVSRDRLNQPSGGGAAPQPAQPSAPRISNPAQLQALPPGSLYVAPDGTTRRKR